MKLCLDGVKRTSTKGEEEARMHVICLNSRDSLLVTPSMHLFPQTANEIMYLGDD
jgi:hypothetical protein